ncbi:MAG: orotidine-5'-phosphate decarboxylase [Granulosicoccus sp.]|nr:orotidine-5'-phosphate decarboxylase [Granulosicoccus sp.]
MNEPANAKQRPVIITALDYPDAVAALALVSQLDPALTNLKVGKELFTRAGPAFVDTLQKLGFSVFLDLKYHDIPNTVAGACRAAVDAGVWMVNVHASGGRRMLDAARKAVDSDTTLLIAVTVLTSLEDADLAALGVNGTVEDHVLRLATLTREAGLDGVVCSPQESALMKRTQGQDFVLVTPGVRPETAEAADQRRVMTPQRAVAEGSDYLVIGRPITQAKNPLTALQAIAKSLTGDTQPEIA